MNVEPFANNRIKLKVFEGANDYINASPIVLGNRRYISTQVRSGSGDSKETILTRMCRVQRKLQCLISTA